MANTRRRKHQRGSIALRGANFFIRYYDSDKKQINEFLCEKDNKHHSKTCAPVKDLAAKTMSRVNAGLERSAQSLPILDFWTGVYLPFAEKNLRPSTVSSYKDIWERQLKDHFGRLRLSEYRPAMATQFLTMKAESLGRNSLNHIRSLMSGIFSHAAALGHVEHNPIRDAKVLGKSKPPGETSHYSLDELENAVSALADDPQAQLVMVLCGFLALRPSEVAGLRFEDFTEDSISIRRAFVRGNLGLTKTPESVATLPLIGPVGIPFASWKAKCGNPKEGWVFANRFGKPFDIRDFSRKKIQPKVPVWKGLYSARRTAATLLTQLTGNPMAASQLLRHKNYSVTMSAYIKADRKALTEGMLQLVTKLNEEKN